MSERKADEKHLKLAGTVKGVHAKLRQSLKKADGDHEAVWSDHLQNTEALTEYADAMRQLATDIWTKNQPETRIEWCRNTCKEYYFNEEGLKKQLRKDKKREYFAKLKKWGESKQAEEGGGDIDVENPGPSEPLDIEDFSQECGVTLPPISKIRLLDVGSCYNPFHQFKEFLSIGIDIAPAVDTVLRCDFLHVSTTEPLIEEATEDHLLSLKSPVKALPKEAFQVVIFSLLLEYFPCAAQRWVCCQKAREVLTMHGILVIITPDSHHQNKNAPMMRSWKKAIESLGFRRWRYEKQDHLHCMVFRKVPVREGEGSPDMMYIPQDFNKVEVEEDKDIKKFDEESVQEGFKELPGGEDL